MIFFSLLCALATLFQLFDQLAKRTPNKNFFDIDYKLNLLLKNSPKRQICASNVPNLQLNRKCCVFLNLTEKKSMRNEFLLLVKSHTKMNPNWPYFKAVKYQSFTGEGRDVRITASKEFHWLFSSFVWVCMFNTKKSKCSLSKRFIEGLNMSFVHWTVILIPRKWVTLR